MLQQLEHKPSRGNPHFERYVDLLIRLHDAMRNGDEDEAERLREQMDEPGLHLNKDEIQWVKGLSSDLYMFDDDESFRPLDRPRLQLLSDIKAATDRSDGEAVLQLLRRAAFVSAEHRAWFRSRAYDMLGYSSLSLRFLSYASAQAPDRLAYNYMMLAKLVQQEDFGYARELALRFLRLPGQPPKMVILSAIALCASAKSLPDAEARLSLAQAIEAIDFLLAAQQQDALPPDDVQMARMVLADAHLKSAETGNTVEASRSGGGNAPEVGRPSLTLERVERLSALEANSGGSMSQALSLLGAYNQQSANQFTERILQEDYAAAA